MYFIVAAKECEEKDLRMTGGIVTRNGDTYHISGGFEMCVDGLWTTICLQMWSDSSATVACRQLGLYYSGSMLDYYLSNIFCLNITLSLLLYEYIISP